jgi:putative addiction module killer protein
MPIQPRSIRNYVTPTGKEPFEEWLESIADTKIRAIIRTRLNRVRMGNFGDTKSLGDDVHELRIHYSPGYRVYFAKWDGTIVILLCGGSKRSQNRDIRRAKEYWQELRSRHD